MGINMKKRICITKSHIATSMAIFLSLVLLSPGLSVAEESIRESRGRILKVNGDVEIINARGEVRKASESRLIIREMDTIVTRKGGKAVVQFTDGALSVLDEKSSLRIEKTNWMSHLGGKIYFTFRKMFGESRKVKTRFATIGIRGTTFIVNDDEDGSSVALQEGQLEVESPGEVYEIHKQKVVDEFEAFKQQAADRQAALQDEYKDYKKQTMKEFVEYKKSFILESNRVIRFDGNRVDDTEMGEEIKAEFDDFEAIAGEMLLEFRQQSKEHREKQEKQAGD
jgi:hypothetical protein